MLKFTRKKFLFMVCCFLCLFTLASCTRDSSMIHVGIVQYVTAPPLDDARLGIIEALADAGYKDGENVKITEYNPQTDTSTLKLMAKSAIRDNDIVFAIATPVAEALVKESEERGSDVPILFTAVTDPVSTHIVSNAEHPGGNISGTTDMNPVAQQVAFIKDLNPNATKLGFLYTAGEDNSIIQLNLARAAAEDLGVTLISQSISNVNELQTATNSLINSGVDAIYLPTDNTIVASASVVLGLTNLHQVPTICGESSFLNVGGTITLGINYKQLGKLTGEMGVKLLKEETKVGDMAVQSLTSFDLVLNVTEAEKNGIPISQELKDKADIIQ